MTETLRVTTDDELTPMAPDTLKMPEKVLTDIQARIAGSIARLGLMLDIDERHIDEALLSGWDYGLTLERDHPIEQSELGDAARKILSMRPDELINSCDYRVIVDALTQGAIAGRRMHAKVVTAQPSEEAMTGI
jgi:hypothetical protein